MNEALRKTLKQLRLSGLLESLEIRLQEAAGHGLSHGEFLELILQDELAVRGNRQLERLVRQPIEVRGQVRRALRHVFIAAVHCKPSQFMAASAAAAPDSSRRAQCLFGSACCGPV